MIAQIVPKQIKCWGWGKSKLLTKKCKCRRKDASSHSGTNLRCRWYIWRGLGPQHCNGQTTWMNQTVNIPYQLDRLENSCVAIAIAIRRPSICHRPGYKHEWQETTSSADYNRATLMETRFQLCECRSRTNITGVEECWQQMTRMYSGSDWRHTFN